LYENIPGHQTTAEVLTSHNADKNYQNLITFVPVVAIDVINVLYVFYSGHVFYVFNVFSTFFILKKTLSNEKYKYVKIQRKIFLEDDLAMIFIDFGLLRSLYCKISC